MKSLRYGLWAIVLLCTLGFTALLWQQSQSQQSTSASFELGAPFTLIDHKGNTITEAALQGQPSVLFFGFTHCPEICPTTLLDIDAMITTLGKDAETLKAFFVTIDPKRDTPEILDTYISNFTDKITGITGKPKDIANLAKAWRIYVKRVEEDDGDYTMDHTASILLLKPDGTFKGTIAYQEDPKTALEKLQNLIDS